MLVLTDAVFYDRACTEVVSSHCEAALLTRDLAVVSLEALLWRFAWRCAL